MLLELEIQAVRRVPFRLKGVELQKRLWKDLRPDLVEANPSWLPGRGLNQLERVLSSLLSCLRAVQRCELSFMLGWALVVLRSCKGPSPTENPVKLSASPSWASVVPLLCLWVPYPGLVDIYVVSPKKKFYRTTGCRNSLESIFLDCCSRVFSPMTLFYSHTKSHLAGLGRYVSFKVLCLSVWILLLCVFFFIHFLLTL